MKATITLTKKYSEVAFTTIAITFIFLSIYIGATYLAIKGILPMIWAIAINALMAYGLFTPMHEAGHLNISGPKKSLQWLDEAIGWLSGITLIAPFYIFKIIHFRHHAHTNDPDKDPDHWLASKSLGALFLHATTIFPIYFYNGFKILFTEKRLSPKIKKELIIGYLVAVLFFTAIGLWWHFQSWVYPILLWVVPAFIAQAFLAFAFDWLPHHPHENKKPYLNTRVIDVPALSLLLLSQNYHLVHHLHPRIPFYSYKKAYDEISDTIEEKGVEIIRWNT